MISQKVYEAMMELCHLYSLLDKSHKALRLSLLSTFAKLGLKRRSQPISRQTFVWLLDSGNFNQTSKQGETFFTINNEPDRLTGKCSQSSSDLVFILN